MSVRVKVCGITRPEDAQHAARAGASAVGLIFWPKSPRFVGEERARDIAAALGESRVTRVGVFVDQAAAFVREMIARVPLDAIQLHGHEAVAEYECGVPILKAFGVGSAWHIGMLADVPAHVVPLLDAVEAGGRAGGIGAVIDWTLAGAAASVRRIVLAGGLTPLNVGRAIATAGPYGVDVSSGVETAPGLKDANRIRAFVEAVEAASGPVPRRLFE